MTKSAPDITPATLEALIDTLPMQVWQMSYSCIYGRVNAAHAEFLGKKREEIERQPIESVLPRNPRRWLPSRRSETPLRPVVRAENEIWRTTPAGKSVFWCVIMTPTLNAAGIVQFLSCTAEDITERWEAEQEILLCRDRIDEQTAQKFGESADELWGA